MVSKAPRTTRTRRRFVVDSVRGGPALTPDRERILATARARFFAEGFHSITMSDLAGDLGMSKKTLYQHFAGKDALLDAVLDDFAGEMSSWLAGIAGEAGWALDERLERVMEGLRVRLSSVQPVFLRSLRRHAPRQFQRLERLRRRNLEENLLPMLKAGRDRGDIRSEVDPALVIALLLQLLDGIWTADLPTGADPPSPARLATGVLDIVFHGILNPSQRSRR